MTATAPEQTAEIRHPIFARFFDRLSRSMEPEVGEHRDRLLHGLGGRVLEIGAGHCSWPTTAAIGDAGFRLTELEEITFGPSWFITNPHLRGVAR